MGVGVFAKIGDSGKAESFEASTFMVAHSAGRKTKGLSDFGIGQAVGGHG